MPSTHVEPTPTGRPNVTLRPVSEVAVSSSAALEAFKASGGASRACPQRAGGARGAAFGRAGCAHAALSQQIQGLRLLGAGYASEPKSSIVAIGLSVHTAPVEMREKLAIAEADWPKAIGELCAFPHVEEAAVLSTCNRMEVYIVALSYHRGVREVEEFLARVRARSSAAGASRKAT
jgi:hypothetical protein